MRIASHRIRFTTLTLFVTAVAVVVLLNRSQGETRIVLG